MDLPILKFFLFGIIVTVIAAVLFLFLIGSVLVAILVAIPRVLRESTQIFWTFIREIIWLKITFRCRKELFIGGNIDHSFLLNHHEKEILNQQALFFSMRDIDCLDSMQCDHTNFTQGQYSRDWVVLVNLCNHELLCLYFCLGW